MQTPNKFTMKKYYVFILALIFSMNLSAQEILLNEPFSTWLPEGWSVIEGPGSAYYSHWFHRDNQYATVYVTADAQDEWLITPEITMPETGELRLSADMMGAPWRMITMDYGDFFVNVSTDNGLTWETIWVEDDQEIVEASGVPFPWPHNEWFYPSINMNDYAGQTIKIAFRYVAPTGDADWWNLDNVIVKSLVENEVILEDFIFPFYGLVNDEFYFEGTFRNLGENDVTSFEVTYSVNDFESEVCLIDNVLIPYNFTYDFMHDIPYTFTDPVLCNLNLKITKVNGHEDPIPGNNVLYRDISIASEVVDRKPLFEVFTSSTCPSCPGANENLDGVLANNPENTYSLVKYQVNWPGSGDPYYIEDNGIRVNYYEVQGVPRMITNGFAQFTAHTFNQENFNQAAGADAYVEIDLSYSFDGLDVFATLDVDPRINIADASVHFVVVEKTTHQNTGTNGETEFQNVVMAMIPDGHGTSTELSLGTVSTFSANANLSATFIEEFDDLMIVAWVQDNYTRSVLQSESYDMDISVGIGANSNETIKIFPNPSNGKITVHASSGTQLRISDTNGKEILNMVMESEFQSLDLFGFMNGIYVVELMDGNQLVIVEKLVLKK